jgi:hypothetical protein
MLSVNVPHESRPAALGREPGTSGRRAAGQAATATALCPHRVARWAWSEGLRAGDTVALLVRDFGQAEALRLGLVRIGVGVATLDGRGRGATLADGLTLSRAGTVIVDTALAEVYAGVMGRLSTYPAVWWNGPGADLANLDHALAEQA